MGAERCATRNQHVAPCCDRLIVVRHRETLRRLRFRHLNQLPRLVVALVTQVSAESAGPGRIAKVLQKCRPEMAHCSLLALQNRGSHDQHRGYAWRRKGITSSRGEGTECHRYYGIALAAGITIPRIG
eukprot:6196410-Pleurochrysis_carterae.AAC.3